MWLLYVAFLQLVPGAIGSPPGTGCQIGTSGCFPSAPPGPVTPPADPGATSEVPPPVVHPNDVPFYGELPAKQSDQPILRQDVQEQEERARQEQRLNELEGHAQQLEQQLEDQRQLLEEQRDLLQQQEERAQRKDAEEKQQQQAEEQKQPPLQKPPSSQEPEEQPAAP